MTAEKCYASSIVLFKFLRIMNSARKTKKSYQFFKKIAKAEVLCIPRILRVGESFAV